MRGSNEDGAGAADREESSYKTVSSWEGAGYTEDKPLFQSDIQRADIIQGDAPPTLASPLEEAAALK
jgi:hypothetical protein